MNTVLEKIRKMGIVPVVVIENEKLFAMADLPAQR